MVSRVSDAPGVQLSTRPVWGMRYVQHVTKKRVTLELDGFAVLTRSRILPCMCGMARVLGSGAKNTECD
jgi:hypothetical protein